MLASHSAAFRRWIADPRSKTPLDGERFDSFAARVHAVLAALSPAGRVLIVAHGGPIRQLVARALGLAWEQAARLEVIACALSRICIFREGTMLACWNDTAHIERKQ